MIFQTYGDGDPREFMYYKDDLYMSGTEIELSDDYINTHKWNGKRLWKYAKFNNKTTYNGATAYFFNQNKIDWSVAGEYAPYFVISTFELEYAIEKVTKPLKLEREITNKVMEAVVTPKTDFDYPILVALWVVYIVLMIACLVFTQFYIPQAILSYIFYITRKDILNK